MVFLCCELYLLCLTEGLTRPCEARCVMVSVSACYQDGLWVVLLPVLEIFLLPQEFLACWTKYTSFLTRVISCPAVTVCYTLSSLTWSFLTWPVFCTRPMSFHLLLSVPVPGVPCSLCSSCYLPQPTVVTSFDKSLL